MTDTPLTADPTIDMDAAGKLLRRVEAHHDLEGWHEHANMCVYVVYDHHDVVTGRLVTRAMRGMGEPVRNSRYTAQPMLPPRILMSLQFDDQEVSPAEALYRFAHNTAFADPDQLGEFGETLQKFRSLLAMPGLLGFISCQEAWANVNMTRADTESLLNSQRRVADLDGSEEVRAAMMVDVHDRVHVVRRHRGKPAELETDVPLRGDVTNSLRILMDAATGRLPTDKAGYDQRYITIRQHLGL